MSVEEYLRTSFSDGDSEYIDGRIVQRNMGDIDHGELQTQIVTYFRKRYPQFWSVVEVRVQVKPSRFRVPDLCQIGRAHV